MGAVKDSTKKGLEILFLAKRIGLPCINNLKTDFSLTISFKIFAVKNKDGSEVPQGYDMIRTLGLSF